MSPDFQPPRTMKNASIRAAAPVLILALLGAACWAGGNKQQGDRPGVGESGPPIKLAVDAPYYVPGEQFYWKISFRGVVGGRAVMVVGEPGTAGDRSVVILRSRVESTGLAAAFKRVRDEVTSWVALDGGRPIFHRADVKFGKKEAAIETRFGPGPFRIDVSRLGHSPKTYTQALPRGHTAHDPQSLLGTLRAWDVSPGTAAYAYVLSGRRIWHLTATHDGRETIETSLGRFETVQISGVAWRLDRDLRVDRDREPRLFRIWLANDETRAPLRIEAKTEHGPLQAELVSYERPPTRVTALER